MIQMLALEHPHLVERMVLFNSPLPFDKERMARHGHPPAAGGGRLLRAPGARRRRAGRRPHHRRAAAALHRHLLLVALLGAPRSLHGRRTDGVRPQRWHAGDRLPHRALRRRRQAAGVLRRLRERVRPGQAERPGAGSIGTRPCARCILFGPSDHVLYPAFDEMAAVVFPDHDGPHRLERCGHFVPWEAPDALVAHTSRFCGDLLGRGRRRAAVAPANAVGASPVRADHRVGWTMRMPHVGDRVRVPVRPRRRDPAPSACRTCPDLTSSSNRLGITELVRLALGARPAPPLEERCARSRRATSRSSMSCSVAGTTQLLRGALAPPARRRATAGRAPPRSPAGVGPALARSRAGEGVAPVDQELQSGRLFGSEGQPHRFVGTDWERHHFATGRTRRPSQRIGPRRDRWPLGALGDRSPFEGDRCGRPEAQDVAHRRRRAADTRPAAKVTGIRTHPRDGSNRPPSSPGSSEGRATFAARVGSRSGRPGGRRPGPGGSRDRVAARPPLVTGRAGGAPGSVMSGSPLGAVSGDGAGTESGPGRARVGSRDRGPDRAGRVRARSGPGVGVGLGVGMGVGAPGRVVRGRVGARRRRRACVAAAVAMRDVVPRLLELVERHLEVAPAVLARVGEDRDPPCLVDADDADEVVDLVLAESSTSSPAAIARVGGEILPSTNITTASPLAQVLLDSANVWSIVNGGRHALVVEQHGECLGCHALGRVVERYLRPVIGSVA